MSREQDARQFSWTDVEEWVAEGLLTAGQAAAIRDRVAGAGPGDVPPRAAAEQRAGLNLITLAYYFGGFMILLAYSFFMGLQWEALGRSGDLAVAAITVGGLWAVGYFLRRAGFPLAGGLLLFAGTGIVPLLVYAVLRQTGLWPDQPEYASPAYHDFFRTIKPVWVTLEGVSLLVTALLLWRVRFPLLTLLIAFWSWYLSMDLTRWIVQGGGTDYDDREQLISILIGLLLLGAGLFLQRRTRQDYSRWLYIFGHIIVLGNFGALAQDKGGLAGLLFLMLYLAFVIASVWLQRPVFVVFGALGCYSYAGYLAFHVFDGALGFVFALAALGLAIVLSAVGYQKYARPWLARRFRPAAVPPAGDAGPIAPATADVLPGPSASR